MAEWKALEIPHSSRVVTGQRVPFWRRPDWKGGDRGGLALASVLVFGGLGWILYHFRQGHAFDGDTIGSTLRGMLFAGLAIALGTLGVYVTFFVNRKVVAACPACGTVDRWTPGDRNSTCFHCLAAIDVDAGGMLREVGLDATGRYRIDSIELDADIADDGRVAVVLPAICAVCGAEPTTTSKVEDESRDGEDSSDSEAEVAKQKQTRRDLGALAIPSCAQHAAQAAATLDGSYVFSLQFTSYRYYRAFILANGLPKQRTESASKPSPTAKARQTPRPLVTPGELEPLLCTSCGAPVAVGEGDTTTCAACGHVATLPEPYRQLRDAKRMSDQDAAELHALAAEVSHPPPAWKRVSMIVGYAVGGATVVAMAIGAIIGGAIGLFAGSPLGEGVAKVLTFVGALAFGLLAIPYMGEWLAASAMLHSTGAATDLVTRAAPAYRYDLVAAAILYGLGIVPIALAWRTQGNLSRIAELQSALAARSTFAGGAPCCRHCGAALDVARDAMVSRCLYCGADNLLSVPPEIAATEQSAAKQLDAKVRDAVDRHARERADDRATMWALLGAGLLLAPFLCVAGYVLHRFLLA